MDTSNSIIKLSTIIVQEDKYKNEQRQNIRIMDQRQKQIHNETSEITEIKK